LVPSSGRVFSVWFVVCASVCRSANAKSEEGNMAVIVMENESDDVDVTCWWCI
jgi:hypothetical protein